MIYLNWLGYDVELPEEIATQWLNEALVMAKELAEQEKDCKREADIYKHTWNKYAKGVR